MIENHHENYEKDKTAWDISRLKTTPPWFWRLPRNFFITSILFSINRKREQPSRKPLLNLNIFSFYTYTNEILLYRHGLYVTRFSKKYFELFALSSKQKTG